MPSLQERNTKNQNPATQLDTDSLRLVECRHHDPFSVLGLHQKGDKKYLRVYRPDAEHVYLLAGDSEIILQRETDTDFFYSHHELLCELDIPRLKVIRKSGDMLMTFDPYSFLPVLDNADLAGFSNSTNFHAHHFLGARAHFHQGVAGVLFSVWAPNAERVSIVADFNDWDGRIHPMRNRGESGIWELFLTDVPSNCHYKFEIRNRDSGQVTMKSDPFARQFAFRPDTASIYRPQQDYHWLDENWMQERAQNRWQGQAMSVYEVHLGSWRRDVGGEFLNYRQLADELVAYVAQMGFTHIQLLPISEHPFDASWGYQVTGYFAPTSRFGLPEDFKYFVDHCHHHNIGVLLDWVPAHFPRDAHGLARFDGSALFEHEDPRKGEHRDWGTLIFNYGRNEVRNFLFSSARFWLEEFHIDGLRVDAVASMLYLDYSRNAGDWVPNQYGGNENLEAVAFLQTLNSELHQRFPGMLMIAEESTSWPGVSHPVYANGLGFTMKWNMGWMNDTLEYFTRDPVHRSYYHEHLTFGLLYAFTENFVLPLSHDEVVHGKRSILNKMPGDSWQQFANVRLLYTYMFSYPGKKLLFMGNEFAQGREWTHEEALEWYVLDHDYQRGVQTLVKDLNRLYCTIPALHNFDFDQQGFRWIDCHDHNQSVISYIRRAGHQFVIVVLNFTPVVREGYRIGVPCAGVYEEILNSDSEYYQGSNVSNGIEIHSEPVAAADFEHSIVLTLPPLGGLFIYCKEIKG